jgi:hypothetical protein
MELLASYDMTNISCQEAMKESNRVIKPAMQPPEDQIIQTIPKVGCCNLKVATISI